MVLGSTSPAGLNALLESYPQAGFQRRRSRETLLGDDLLRRGKFEPTSAFEFSLRGRYAELLQADSLNSFVSFLDEIQDSCAIPPTRAGQGLTLGMLAVSLSPFPGKSTRAERQAKFDPPSWTGKMIRKLKESPRATSRNLGTFVLRRLFPHHHGDGVFPWLA